ncbi:frequency clock protein [Diplodia corticola]|uniref:Frequency clock protein n=1 Tax=Diplodia corticola TaxID=236234 RepID=A0A1J9RXW5_9PEZI|nr:frequency clock protein [Diplodia corticola]OJD32660.1 frequency clock protein [Diplodia corticola]
MSDPQSNHPRRPPAHKSVSLLHSPGKRKFVDDSAEARLSRTSSNVPSSDRANPSSPGSSRPGTKKESSGEVSDAGKWFETSNNNISQNSTGFVDNDPPFFLRNSSSSTSPDMTNPMQMHIQGQSSMPHRPALMHMRTDGSSTEEFRSVIDDLTIENKKLKKKLRKYEKMHDAHLQNEKLFEVRVHRLAPDKKRELEETLRKFAMELEDSIANEPARPHDPRATGLHVRPTLSSYTSTQFGDSAYMSASGQNSNTASGSNGQAEANPPPKSKSHYHRQHDSIQSYLHDIPAGLMPKTIAMTESAKKKLVVRRMEQIFTGKGAGTGGHQQPIQQQEVAQSAAQADRAAIEEETGQEARIEGLREARIMYSKSDQRHGRSRERAEACKAAAPLKTVSNHDFAKPTGKHSPEQRPTRPLDLDPQRAQVPTENINYIRHLGFSPPDPEIPPVDNHGWIYLNLLVNMAQLHTINVTTDFVKKALEDYSSMLELSPDGRKIRWKGGQDTSLNSTDSSPEHQMELIKSNVNKIGKKRQKLGPSSTNTSSETTGQSSELQRSTNHLAYTPLFYRKESTEDYDGSNLDRNSEEEASPLPAHATGNTSSGFASSGMRTSSSKRKRDDGPIIFYNKAKFCTDLSGDSSTHDSPGYTNYNHYIDMPLGATPEKEREKTPPMYDDCRGPLARAALHEMDADMDMDPSDVDLEFSKSSSTDGDVIPKAYLDFEASGIGGIVPEDNFAIDVECRQVRSESAPATHYASHTPRYVNYPSNIMRALKAKDKVDQSGLTRVRTPIVNGEIISAQQMRLPPSTLPPPSLLPFESSSGDVDTDMSDVSEMDDEFDEFDEPPTAAPRLVDMSTPDDEAGESGDQEEDGEDYVEEDEGSLDFLAQAREIDPEMIRVQEREYDANIADRLAEEIPAGSSAATAGGGSGFNSPASLKGDGDDAGTDRRPSSRGSHSIHRGSLKRSRTSDSMIVHGKASQ